MKKKVLISAALIIAIVISVILYQTWPAVQLALFVANSHTSEKVIKRHPFIGKTYEMGSQAFYFEDCNNFHSCGDTPKAKEINRTLACNSLGHLRSLYDNWYEVDSGTTFILIELLKIESYGLDAMGGPGYVLAVFKDSNDILSTRLFSSLDEIDDPYGVNGGKICTPNSMF